MKLLLELPSVPHSVARLDHLVERIANEYHIGEELHGDILISLTEALNNAILHGNHNDGSKHVRIEVEKNASRLIFVVTDEGKGFDCEHLPNPTTPENQPREGGRGVFLMRHLCHSLHYRNGGSSVELAFEVL